MKIHKIVDWNTDVFNSSNQKQLVVGSREQSKTDIIVKDALLRFELNPSIIESTLFLVTEKRQIKKLREKFRSSGFINVDKLDIRTYTSLFYEIYKEVLFKDERTARLMDYDDSLDREEIISQMEIILATKNMFFEEFPAAQLWKEFEEFSYKLGKVWTKPDTYWHKKVQIFCKEMIRSFVQNGCLTQHMMVLSIMKKLTDVQNVRDVNKHMKKYRLLYCDDIHFLTETTGYLLCGLLKNKESRVIATADRYHVPQHLFDLNSQKTGASYILKDEAWVVKVIVGSPELTKNQALVYEALTDILEPLIPLETTKKRPHTKEELNNVLQIYSGNKYMIDFPTKIFEQIKLQIDNGKSVAFYHNNLKIAAVVESLLLTNGVDYHTSSRYTFWTNPHNSFIATYVSFFSDDVDVSDLVDFFGRLIPKFGDFEEEALKYIREGIKTNYKNIHQIELAPKIDSISKSMFKAIFFDLLEIRRQVRDNWRKKNHLILVNKWIRKYVGNYEENYSGYAPSYIKVLEQVMQNPKIKSIYDLCKLINILEDKEFYNYKDGVLISDSDFFKYKKHDVIILLNGSRWIGSELRDQSKKTLSLVYEVAGSFNDSMILFIKQKKGKQNFDHIFEELLSKQKVG